MKNLHIKNSAFFALLLLLGSIACTKDANDREAKSKTVDPKTINIVAESGLNYYLAMPPNTTWHDLDAFYKDGIEKYCDRPELSSFKSYAIFFMVNFYNMTGDQSAEATERIAYYAEEMAALKSCNAESLHRMLIRMQGHWAPAKIARVASTGYQNSQHVFKILDKEKPGYTVWENRLNGLLALAETK